MAEFRVTLADKPTDLLVYLVDHGPATADEIAKALGVTAGLYSGGLNVLRELGLARLAQEPDRRPYRWAATDGGIQVADQARGCRGRLGADWLIDG